MRSCQKVREGGRVINVHTLITLGVNIDGHREIPGTDVATSEDGPGWLAFPRSLIARGLSGVPTVISDAHAGLVDAIGASQHRRRTHYAPICSARSRNRPSPGRARRCGPSFEQPDTDAVKAQIQHAPHALTFHPPAQDERGSLNLGMNVQVIAPPGRHTAPVLTSHARQDP